MSETIKDQSINCGIQAGKIEGNGWKRLIPIDDNVIESISSAAATKAVEEYIGNVDGKVITIGA